MINWQHMLTHGLTSDFEALFTFPPPNRYIDKQISKVRVKYPKFSEIQWPMKPSYSKSKTFTECEGEVSVQVYEWKGKHHANKKIQAKIVILITQQWDVVGIIDSGIQRGQMLYVGCVGAHPIVATKNLQFLNSDGSSQWEQGMWQQKWAKQNQKKQKKEKIESVKKDKKDEIEQCQGAKKQQKGFFKSVASWSGIEAQKYLINKAKQFIKMQIH